VVGLIGRMSVWVADNLQIAIALRFDNKYISKIRDAVAALKKKTAVFQYVHRLHAAQRSSYYYINEERKTLWKRIIEPENKLSPFQRLFKDNPKLALKQLMAS